MTTLASPPSAVTTAKNFLTSAERQSGAITSWALAAVGLFGLYIARDTVLGLLDFGIAAVGKTLFLGGLAFVAWFLFMWITNPRTQVMLRHLNYAWCRKISTIAMKADPFGRMKAFANEYLQEQWSKFNDAAVRISTQLDTVKRKIEKHQETLAESNKKAAALQTKYCPTGTWASEAHQNNFRLEAQRIELTEQALEKLRKSEVRLATLVKILDRWRETFRFQIESTRLTAESLEQQYNEARDTEGAITAASVAFGAGDMAEADKEVRNYIEALTSGHIARAEVLMKQIPELTAVGDLRGEAAEAEIMRRLTVLDTESQQALSTATEDQKLLSTGDSLTVVGLLQSKTAEPQPVKKSYLRRSA